MPKLKILAWNFATWATFPQVLLHKSLKFSKFYQELSQELQPKLATKSSFSRTELRTLP